MATLQDIRKRVNSVKNTQKITRAMKMVAAAKLRRAQQAMTEARPYAGKMAEMVQNVMGATQGLDHPLLTPRESVKKIAILVLASDRGLCGPFNGALLRQTYDFYKEQQKIHDEVKLYLIGRKSLDFFRARGVTVDQTETGVYDTVDFNYANQKSQDLIQEYLNGDWDRLYLAFNAFKSAIVQDIRIDSIFPVMSTHQENEETPDYTYEPKEKELLVNLVPKYLASQIYQAFLESMASEHGARMAAMDSATNNCSDLIRNLTLEMNRLRQATITTELIDIVNGAAAL
jgi:F-type H+-transporting ATPase subunit gamma